MYACARNLRCHTASDKQKRCKPKKQLQKQPVLWCRKNRHTHIKTKNQSTKKSADKTSPCPACDNLHNQKAAYRTNQNQKAMFRTKP